MEKISLRNLGNSGVQIAYEETRIFIDAFHELSEKVELRNGDILLFTHDDADHYDSRYLPKLSSLDVQLMAPPTVILDLIQKGMIRAEQAVSVNSPLDTDPVSLEIDEVSIQGFNTPHFLGWKTIHCSFLIKLGAKRIFVTGDYSLKNGDIEGLDSLDGLVCNLVDEGFIKQKEDPRFAIHHLLSYLLRITGDYKLKWIYGVHLVNFEWTPSAEEMKKLVKTYGFDHIYLPQNSQETIALEL